MVAGVLAAEGDVHEQQDNRSAAARSLRRAHELLLHLPQPTLEDQRMVAELGARLQATHQTS
jgi:hypothetical protein